MLNKAVLIGRFTADPELRHTPSNIPVTSFTLAVERNYVRQGEQRQTDFIDIVAWRQTAEFITRFFHKGQMIAVSGFIQTRNWEDRDGKKRKSVEVVVDEAYFVEPKRDSSPATAAPAFTDNDAPLDTSGSGFSELDDGELPF